MKIRSIIQDGLIRLWPWYRKRMIYCVADATDNSISLSKTLCRIMKVMELDEAKVYVFRLSDSKDYCFTINPILEKDTQLADIQYNSKHHTVGFESLCPTVNRIFYDYGLPHDSRAKLTVEVCRADLIPTYYHILRPRRHE